MAEVAACPNVVVMRDGLMVRHHAPAKVGSDEAAAVMLHHILTAIDLFTPQRSMFESNFPVDAHAISYGALWNAFKRLIVDFNREEREMMFARTTAQIWMIKI